MVGSTGTYLVSVPASTGVYGSSTLIPTGRGVWGKAAAGRGVYGEATSGAGVYGYASTGYAIEGNGRLRFLKVSGVATIAAGDAGVAVSPGVSIGPNSFVLLTPLVELGGRDLWFTTNDPADTFAIHMSSARGTPTKIAWLLLG